MNIARTAPYPSLQQQNRCHVTLPSPPDSPVPAPSPEPGLLRRAVKGVAGLAGGALTAVYQAPVGLATGMAAGLAEKKSPQEKKDLLRAVYGNVAVGEVALPAVLAGASTLGLPGAVILGSAGLIAGTALLVAAGAGGAAEQIVDRVQEAVDQALADNADETPAARKWHNAAEGAVVGLGTGAGEGYRIGRQAGQELADLVFFWLDQVREDSGTRDQEQTRTNC